MTRAALWLIGLSTALRLAVAGWLPLGTDETYAIAVAREFSWSFFDHPPIGFWLPVGMAWVTGLEQPLIFRLPYVALGTVTSVAVWRLGHLIGGERAAHWGLILFLLAPYMMIGGGLFVVPDGPLNAFSALAALALARAVSQDHPPLRAWAATGGWLALAMACKYQAALFPVAALLFLLTARGQWRRMLTAGPWLAAGIGLLGLTPVVIWNIQHDWASFAFHTGRVGAAFQPLNFGRMVLGQALYLLPATFVVASVALVQAFRRDTAPAAQLLGWLAALPVVMFMITYIYGTNTFPHWTMPGWLFAMPLAGAWLAAREPLRWLSRSIWLGAIAIWAVLATLIGHIPTGHLTRKSDPVPDWDNTIEIFDYSDLGPALTQRGLLAPDTLIVARDWIEGGHLSTALHGHHDIRILGPEQHHFQYMAGASLSGPGLLLVPVRGDAAPDLNGLDATARITPLTEIPLTRAGRPYLRVFVYRVTW